MLTAPYAPAAGAGTGADGGDGNIRFSSIVTIDRSNYTY